MDKINQTARGTGASVESEQETGYDIPLYHRPLNAFLTTRSDVQYRKLYQRETTKSSQ